MAEIFQHIERKVAVMDENKTALEAARLMTERFIGSVVVMGSPEVKGIFTERDLTRILGTGRNPADVRLKDMMAPVRVTVSPHESVERCLELMKNNKCRHLLVFDGAEFVGLVSLRDLVLLMLEEKEALIGQLTSYITG